MGERYSAVFESADKQRDSFLGGDISHDKELVHSKFQCISMA